jgi:hypothetical protein
MKVPRTLLVFFQRTINRWPVGKAPAAGQIPLFLWQWMVADSPVDVASNRAASSGFLAMGLVLELMWHLLCLK